MHIQYTHTYVYLYIYIYYIYIYIYIYQEMISQRGITEISFYQTLKRNRDNEFSNR